MNDDKFFKTNLKRWNELVDINVKSKGYDLEGFKSGKTSLFPIELEELGDVNGKSLLHLQCHFGQDTLSWARLGAKVTGVDFSDNAIAFAKELSKELDIPGRFIMANIYDIPSIINEQFDIVFTSYGAICWLPDMVKWAQIIADCLKLGGMFYIIDSHPFGSLIDEHQEVFNVGYKYFSEGEPIYWNEDGAYADQSAELKNRESYDWIHSMSTILNALINANLEIEYLHEFPFMFFSMHPDMKKRDDGYWEFVNFEFNVPMMFSIKAHKKT